MSPVFDGRRTILGNNDVVVPQVETAAVEQPELADIPGLAELDRGLSRTGAAPVQPPRTATSSPPIATLAVERAVGGWAAAAITAFGLVLGATAAAAVFHDDISYIVATWDQHR